MVIQPIFIGASSFSCGYALVGNKEQVYFIDTKGQTQQGRYDNAYSFNNGYARVSLDYKWGCINTDMNMLVQPEYNHMREMSDGMVAVTMLCDMWGYVNDKGEVAIPITPTYIQVGNFYQGLAPVRNDELKWGCINKNNDYVIPPVYDWLEDFHEGLAAFYRNEKWGFLNTSGVEITPAIYEQAYHFFNGLAPVLKNG